jgi:hypothetical protein
MVSVIVLLTVVKLSFVIHRVIKLTFNKLFVALQNV